MRQRKIDAWSLPWHQCFQRDVSFSFEKPINIEIAEEKGMDTSIALLIK